MRRPTIALVLLLGSLGAFGLSGCSAGPAGTQDYTFGAAVNHDGIPHDWTMDMPKLGRAVCSDINGGETYGAAILNVATLTKDAGTVNTAATFLFTSDQARMLVNDAITTYCPAHGGDIQ